MEGVTSSRSNKHHKAPKEVQYLFITNSLLEKLSFPVYIYNWGHDQKVPRPLGRATLLRKLWSAVPNGAYHQNSEAHARDFTMPGVELFFQVNTKSPNFFTKNANKPSKLKISKGIASGIDRNLGEKTLKHMFVPEKHGISHIERIRDVPY